MTAPIPIPAHDRHGIRVFAVAIPASDIPWLTRAQHDRSAEPEHSFPRHPAIDLLGVEGLHSGFVELFEADLLAEFGLANYLTTGCGVPEDQIAPDRERLDTLRGLVLVVFSKAFCGKSVTLHPDPRLTLIGTYSEDRPPVHFQPLPTAAAQGVLTPSVPNTKPTGIPAAFLLLGTALLVTGLAALLLAIR
jgi:hypothetical protein